MIYVRTWKELHFHQGYSTQKGRLTDAISNPKQSIIWLITFSTYLVHFSFSLISLNITIRTIHSLGVPQ